MGQLYRFKQRCSGCCWLSSVPACVCVSVGLSDCNGGRSKAAPCPAEPRTIPPLCLLLLGAQETKRKCKEHVNQTRYSTTITSLSDSQPSTPKHPRQALGPAAPALERPTCARQCDVLRALTVTPLLSPKVSTLFPFPSRCHATA